MRESRPRSTLDCRNGCKVVPDASQLADAASPQPIGGALVSIDDLRAVCSGCSMRELCMPFGLDADDLAQIDTLVGSRQRLHKGEALYDTGETFDALYAVRVGSLKTAVLAEDGREQVTGYHMIGDQSNLRRLLSREISRDQSVMLLLGSMRAEARVAAFLLDLAERYRRRGYSSTQYVLRMTGEEIGSYLGLKLETVSRLFSKLQNEGIVRVQGRNVALLDPGALRQLCAARE